MRSPVRGWDPMLDAALARRLKLVGFDVDGVLTDNGLYVGMVGDHRDLHSFPTRRSSDLD